MTFSTLHALLLFCLACAGPLGAREVKLAWNPNPEPDLAGYELLVGKASGSYSQTIALGNTTAHTLTGLEGSTVYYFGLRAVNAAGLKSDVAEISHVTLADVPPLDSRGWIASASSAETLKEDNQPANAIDGDARTLWHTTWGLAIPPHYLRVQLPRTATLTGLRYLPRQDTGTNGIVTSYEIQTSMDGVEWQNAATGTWAADPSEKYASLPMAEARHVRLWGNDPRMSAAEINLEGSYSPDAGKTLTLTIQDSADLASWQDVPDVPPVTRPLENPRRFYRLKIETP